MKPLLPYVETPSEEIPQIMKFAGVHPGQRSIDLGAGDGRIVIAMARAGAIAYGVEIQERYVRRAKRNIALDGLIGKAVVEQKDFWEIDLGEYDIVTIYGMAAIIEQVGEKLAKELQSGAIVISNGFKLPGWKLSESEGFLYKYVKR